MNYNTTSAHPGIFPRKLLAIVIPVSLACWGLSTLILTEQAGTPPTKSQPTLNAQQSNHASSQVAHGASQQQELSEALVALREASLKSPREIEPLMVYLEALAREYHSQPPGQSAVTFPYIEALQRLRILQPENPDPLRALANISFDNRVFTKAQTYFKDYLAMQPEDLSSRTRYASALAFSGAFDDAIAELDAVLAKEPGYFSALAYKAITLAQMNNFTEAKKIGKLALANAPHDEAKERFTAFLASLESKSMEETVPASTGTNSPLEEFLRSHQITGSKFVKLSVDKSVVSLTFQDFPMSQMPPFAKTSFLEKVKTQAKASFSEVTEIRFIDRATGSEMEKVVL